MELALICKSLNWERVMRVMGEINRAGLTRVGLVTTEERGR